MIENEEIKPIDGLKKARVEAFKLLLEWSEEKEKLSNQSVAESMTESMSPGTAVAAQ